MNDYEAEAERVGGGAFPHRGEWGMSLRDYFAAAALQGIVAYNGFGGVDMSASEAYRLADAMLKERQK